MHLLPAKPPTVIRSPELKKAFPFQRMHMPPLYSFSRANAVHFAAASVALAADPSAPPGTVGPLEAKP